MASKLQAFMRPELLETPEKEIPGISAFCDDKGEPIPFKIRKLTMDNLNKARREYTNNKIVRDAKNKPFVVNGAIQYRNELDDYGFGCRMIVDALIFPDLHDPDLLKFYKCNEATELASIMFRDPKVYNYLITEINTFSGLDTEPQQLLDEAKNS